MEYSRRIPILLIIITLLLAGCGKKLYWYGKYKVSDQPDAEWAMAGGPYLTEVDCYGEADPELMEKANYECYQDVYQAISNF